MKFLPVPWALLHDEAFDRFPRSTALVVLAEMPLVLVTVQRGCVEIGLERLDLLVEFLVLDVAVELC